MSISYHGNYCGPGWSAGKKQQSVVSNVEAVDAFDQTCKTHDEIYARGGNLYKADITFAGENLSVLDFKRNVAGLIVGTQGVIRGVSSWLSSDFSPNDHRPYDRSESPVGKLWADEIPISSTYNQPYNIHSETNMARTKLAPLTKAQKLNLSKVSADIERLNVNRPKTRGQRAKLTALPPSIRLDSAPVSIGSTICASKPIIQHRINGTIVRGREFLCSVNESSNSNFQMAACAPLHPSFYPSSTMGTLARGYQHYRFNSCNIHFVTRQPTSSTGEIALVYSSIITEPAETGSSASFLPRVMTRGNAILGPIWTNHSISVDCDTKFRLIDPFVGSDVAEQIYGEVQAYVQGDTASSTAGYLLIDYELEFKTPMFSAHSTTLPLTSGPGAQFTLTDSSTTPTANASTQLTNATVANASTGSIWKFFLNADLSTPSTGTTAANAWQTITAYYSTTTALTNQSINLPIVSGMIFYAVVTQNASLYIYSTLEEAISGISSGQIFYRTTGSTAASWVVNGYVVRIGTVNMTTVS